MTYVAGLYKDTQGFYFDGHSRINLAYCQKVYMMSRPLCMNMMLSTPGKHCHNRIHVINLQHGF